MAEGQLRSVVEVQHHRQGILVWQEDKTFKLGAMVDAMVIDALGLDRTTDGALTPMGGMVAVEAGEALEMLHTTGSTRLQKGQVPAQPRLEPLHLHKQ